MNGVSRALLAVTLGAAALASCSRRPSPPSGGKAVHVLVTSIPSSLDPTKESHYASRVVYANVYEPLVRVTASGALVPALAESWANPTPDVLVFRLRAGSMFHDGTPLRASDVVASLLAAKSPSSVLAGHLSEVTEVWAPTPEAVHLRVRAGGGMLLQALTAVLVFREGPMGLPIGSGAYKVTSFDPGHAVRLEYASTHRGERPFVAAADFHRFTTPEEAIAFMSSSAESIVPDPPAEVVAWTQGRPGFVVAQELTGSVTYLAFNLAPGFATPFRDLRVRQAVQSALDLDSLARQGGVAGGVPTGQVVPPGVAGFNPLVKPPRRDVRAAKALFASAGFSEGFDMEVEVPNTREAIGIQLCRQISEAGLRAKVRVFPAEEFQKRIALGSPCYLYNWLVGPEAGEALRYFFHTKDASRGWGLRNRTGYSNAAVDRLIERAFETVDPTQRLSALQETVRLLSDDLPWIPLVAGKTLSVSARNLVLAPRLDGMLILSEIRPRS